MTLIEEQFGSMAEGSVLPEDEDIPPIVDFEQDGKLLKIAVKGLTVQDYVKRLQESDILVAIDGKIYRDGPLKLRELFEAPRENAQSGWLLTFWRDGAIFDLLINSPIESRFGLATEQETEWAMEEFEKHPYADISSYKNYEVYRSTKNVCDVISVDRDPLAFIFPALWCLKYRLYPPLAVLMVSYGVTFFINIYLFVIAYLILGRFVDISQTNILRSFTLYQNKQHYMTIAATNEKDVNAILKKIDFSNKVRFEPNVIKPRARLKPDLSTAGEKV